MDGKKDKKSERTGTVRIQKNTLQKYYKMFREYYKNISKIFQMLLTILSKCNIYNTKENT